MSIFKKIFSALSAAEKKIFWGATLTTAVTATILISLSIVKATGVVPAPGGVYSEGVIGQPSNINPVLSLSENDKLIVRLIFSNLYDLSQDIEHDQSGKAWNVRLKENVYWSDGAKLTSDDVIFTVEKIDDPSSQSPLATGWQGVSVGRVSELELKFTLASSYAFFEDNLKKLYIAPKHLFAEIPVSNWRLSEYDLKPVGSGPYQFDSYQKEPGGFITGYRLKANPRYFGEKPYIGSLEIRFFPKSDDVIAAFNNGLINGFAGLYPETLAKIERPYQVFPFRLPIYYAVFWNQGQNIALKDPAVREALAAAVDKNNLTRKVFGRWAVPLENIFESDADSKAGEADPIAKAAALLDKARWQKNGQGFREKMARNSKVPLSFDLTVPNISFLVATARELESAWQKLGAQANLIIISPEEAMNSVKNRSYQGIIFGNVLNPPPDLYSFWHSSEKFYPGLNLALYSNKTADQLIESIRQNFNPGARAGQLNSLLNLIASDHPALFLYSPDYLLISSKDLKGVEPGSISEPADRFLRTPNWYLKTARVLK